MINIRPHNHSDRDQGSPRWFYVEHNLNNYVYLLGTSRREKNALPDNISNKLLCSQRWGQKIGGKFWYAKKGFSESPRMRYRVEKLYQVTHQRPIGHQRGISLGIACGLIAEKLGYAVDWASYAAKQCKIGNKPFESMEESKSRTRTAGGDWPSNKVVEEDESNFDGAPDDWEVNRIVSNLNLRLVNGYNLKKALASEPNDAVAPPLYSQSRNFGVTEETETVEDSLEEEPIDGAAYAVAGNGPGVADNKQGGTSTTWKGESSSTKQRPTNLGHKWDGCPLSPDVSTGFPEGPRRAQPESEDKYWNTESRSREKKEGVLGMTSPCSGGGKFTEPDETYIIIPSEEPPVGLELFMEVYSAVCDEMDKKASKDGFYSFN